MPAFVAPTQKKDTQSVDTGDGAPVETIVKFAAPAPSADKGVTTIASGVVVGVGVVDGVRDDVGVFDRVDEEEGVIVSDGDAETLDDGVCVPDCEADGVTDELGVAVSELDGVAFADSVADGRE